MEITISDNENSSDDDADDEWEDAQMKNAGVKNPASLVLQGRKMKEKVDSPCVSTIPPNFNTQTPLYFIPPEPQITSEFCLTNLKGNAVN